MVSKSTEKGNSIISQLQNQKWTSDNEETDGCAALRSAIRPLIVYGRLTGARYYSDDDSRPVKIVLSISFTSVALYTLFCFVRSLFYIDIKAEGLTAVTSIKLFVIVTFFSGVVTTAVNFGAQRRIALMLRLAAVDYDTAESCRYIRRAVWIIVGGYSVYVCGCAASSPLAVFGLVPTPFVARIVWGSDNQNYTIYPSYVLLDVAALFVAQNAILYCTANYVLFCIIFYNAASGLNTKMEQADLPVDEYQRCYQRIFEGVKVLNRSYQHFCTLVFSQIVFMSIVIFFISVQPDSGGLSIYVLGNGVVYLLLMMLYCAAPATKLNDQNEQLIHTAYRIRSNYARKFGQAAAVDLQLFAMQMSTTPLAITASSCFTINRSVILTLFSIIATYLIVILQFANQSCLCTP